MNPRDEASPATGSPLQRQRCRNHEMREAAARCPSCGRYFCRECVTEHEGRILCAPCLIREAQSRATASRRMVVRPALAALAGFVALWFVFYLAGQILLALPSKFHDGVRWDQGTK